MALALGEVVAREPAHAAQQGQGDLGLSTGARHYLYLRQTAVGEQQTFPAVGNPRKSSLGHLWVGLLGPGFIEGRHAYRPADHLKMAIVLGFLHGKGEWEMDPQPVIAGDVFDFRADINARHAQG